MDETALRRKLASIEALWTGATTDGERDAAAAARERIRARLAAVEPADPPIELVYNLASVWSVRLFVALARRYGLEPYRYRRQRHTTVVLRAPRRFLDETFWPAFLALDRTLLDELDAAAQRAIEAAVHRGGGDAACVEAPALPPKRA